MLVLSSPDIHRCQDSSYRHNSAEGSGIRNREFGRWLSICQAALIQVAVACLCRDVTNGCQAGLMPGAANLPKLGAGLE